ncbi:UBX domain protein [Aspergillus nomiae NRRL 13137]|uniref:UBX domain-containing protein 2 n=1 Tax=Aspergillus nomiae NRRL (strain ATCC 15546 / NRRL 13137 / CBS 260.88 / M93) TaxID=1509407 RepID=A0A0L1J286_ASPN3|nr:UBX domain protein [Aspergillus nomiae NRRL 13137]KNG85864.1 UBX domain protein [Aspergillus nomiae NRRL 13137]
MFFSGTLQEGIALAVSQAKAVICFVRDNDQTSNAWEEDYFADKDFAQLLESRSVLLRLTKDSQEATFLTSFCPVTKFPAVVVIKNGMLREYIVPDITKDDFHSRLKAALEDSKPADELNPNSPAQGAQGHTTSPSASSHTAPATAPQPEPSPAPVPAVPAPAPASAEPQGSESQRQQGQQEYNSLRAGGRTYRVETPGQTQKSQPKKQETPKSQGIGKPKDSTKKQKEPETKATNNSASVKITNTPAEERKPQTPTPPKQYRLQVRLFDGSSIRSSFSPSQTIRGDVRPWIDSQPGDEKRPYNLKHILTPLPNRTLTIAEEEQTLAELGLGSTANLVMVPINTYTEAYSATGSSLPARAVSSAYELVSSAVGTATGLVGSFFGYGQPASTPSATPQASTSSPSPSGDSASRPRPPASRGPIIRTLRDQRNEQNDSQFYNGNQLNFEPRQDPGR